MPASYRYVKAPGHLRAYSDGRIKEHILVAERAFGGPLPASAKVHHHDGDKRNNRNDNLVICQDSAYHNLIHMRARALRESGDANNRWCYICQTWDRADRLIDVGSHTTAHRTCKNTQEANRYAANKDYYKIKNARRYAGVRCEIERKCAEARSAIKAEIR